MSRPKLATYGDFLEPGPRRVCGSLLRGSRLHYLWFRLRRRFARVERWSDDGVDYTGWTVRLLQTVDGALTAGLEGTVVGFQSQRQGKFWTVRFRGVGSFEETDFLTTLPAPDRVELTAP